jgi:mRNA-degrading endonuclease RelE of RelBE toxin-antitoxin system
MKGVWKGSIRIRQGDIRIILSVDEDVKIIHVRVIDFRGSVY